MMQKVPERCGNNKAEGAGKAWKQQGRRCQKGTETTRQKVPERHRNNKVKGANPNGGKEEKKWGEM